MKLLLDENLPRKLKYRFELPFEVLTVTDLGWSGKKNGELLRSMQEMEIAVLITGDKNLPYQQNIDAIPIIILVLDAPDNRYVSLLPFVALVTQHLSASPALGLKVLQLPTEE